MSLKKRLIPTMVGAALALSASTAGAVSFNGVYIFGDSLSDSGYYRPGIAALVGAQSAAALGKFTTNPGPVWSELIAQYYGGNPAPSNAGGGIYAQGGMQVTGNAPTTGPTGGRLGPGGTQRPMATQITEYLTANGGVANPNALFGVWFGANDFFSQVDGLLSGSLTVAQVQANVPGIAAAEVAQVARLQAAGARYIMAFNLPDIGATLSFSTGSSAALAPLATGISAGLNTSFFTGLRSANVKVIPVDIASLTAEVRANPAAYGFTNTTATACNLALTQGTSLFCSQAALVSANAGQTYFFADGVHPTAGVHAIFADFAKSLIDGPNAYSVMAEIPLSTRASHIRTLDEGLRQGQSGNIGKLSVFAAGDGSKYDISQNALSPKADTKNKALSVGITMRASDSVTVGAALGSTKGEARMGGIGQFDINENAVSFFGSAKSGPFYASFTGSFADVKYDNIRRSIKLGAVTRTATASSKGANSSYNLTGGYDHEFGRLSIGPFASVTLQDVTVNAFTEEGAGSANLNIAEQVRRSRVVSVGARASMAFGNWVPFARASLDRDGKKEDRFVSANPVTVNTGSYYDIPGYKPDPNWVTASVGVRGKLADRLGVSVVYTGVSGKTGVKQDGVSASVSYDF